MWTLYDRLLKDAASTDKIASVEQGESWTLVTTEGGLVGLAATYMGRSGKTADPAEFIGLSITEAAAFVKSWDWEKACVGLAAINSVMNQDAHFPITENPDVFLRYKDRFLGKKVAVVGHFAYLEKRLQGLCDLYVLERQPAGEDYPDPACEYLLPDMDVVIITGSAASNKTLPRLLELSRNAFTVVTGPSTTLNPALFDFGADALGGFVVTDADACRRSLGVCGGVFQSGRMICLEKEAFH